MAATQQIFISYAREDSKSKEAVFDVLVNNLDLKQVRPWKDDLIPAGQYEQTINREIHQSDFYILLISKSFTSSEFIMNKELPLIIEESKKGKIIIPIILKDYSRGELSQLLPQISKFQYFPRKEKNLAAFSSPELAWSQLTNDIQFSFYGHLKKSTTLLRIAFASLLGICGLIAGYFIVRSTGDCPDFRNKVDLKTLIFPIDNDQSHIEKTLDIKFIKACQKYKIETDNKFIRPKKNETLSSGQQIDQAKKCGGDLLLSGTLQKVNGEDYFDGFFYIVNDTISLYKPSELLTENELVPISLNSLIQSSHLNQAFEQLIQTVLGFICYKKGDYPNAILAMRAGRIDTMGNSKLRIPSYQVLTDAYYKSGLIDSSLSCLDKLEKWSSGNVQILLKKAVIATEAKEYTVAIESYSKLLDKDPNRKDLLLEKRGDLLVEIKDYGKAKKDYEESKSKSKNPDRLNSKITKVDAKILTNQKAIQDINSQGGKLTNQQLLQASDLHMQNGEVGKAKLLLEQIDKPDAEDSGTLEQLKFEVLLDGKQIRPAQIPKRVLEKSPRLKSRALVK